MSRPAKPVDETGTSQPGRLPQISDSVATKGTGFERRHLLHHDD